MGEEWHFASMDTASILEVLKGMGSKKSWPTRASGPSPGKDDEHEDLSKDRVEFADKRKKERERDEEKEAEEGGLSSSALLLFLPPLSTSFFHLILVGCLDGARSFVGFSFFSFFFYVDTLRPHLFLRVYQDLSSLSAPCQQ